MIDGLTPEELAFRPDDEANSIVWLVWHLTRVQDDHVADMAGTEQVWTSSGWSERFGLSLPVPDTGYGHRSGQVAAVTGGGDQPAGYHDAATTPPSATCRGCGTGDLDRIVDERRDPPVTMGVRLVSIVSDDLQHAGQAPTSVACWPAGSGALGDRTWAGGPGADRRAAPNGSPSRTKEQVGTFGTNGFPGSEGW